MKLAINIILITIFVQYSLLSQDDALQKGSSNNFRSHDVFIGVPIELQKTADRFFKTLTNYKVEAAFEEFLENSPISQKKNGVKKLIDRTKRSFELYGEIKGVEPVSAEIVTPSFMKLRYLGLHTKFPMRWIITFYKSPVKGWIIVNIIFDDLAEYYFTDS